MAIVAGIQQRVAHSYFDRFSFSGLRPAPVYRFFQCPVGMFVTEACANCGHPVPSLQQRTLLDTNLELAGMLPSPRRFLVTSISITHSNHHRCHLDSLRTFLSKYVFNFQLGKEIVLSLPATDLVGQRHIVPEALLEIESQMFFCAELRAEEPVPLDADIAGKLWLDGQLYREVQ